MFSTRELLPCVAFITSAALSQAAVAQIVGVDFNGDYGGNTNSSLDNGPQLQVDSGDFNGDGISDARTFIPIDHAGNFIDLSGRAEVGTTAGETSVFRAGMQITNYSSATPSNVGVFRFNGSRDSLQMGTAAQAGGAVTQGFVFAPHISKNNFVGGLAGANEISFLNQADTLDMSYFFSTNVVASAPAADEQLRRGRFMVQDGSQWYLSESRIGSKGSAATPNDLSINPATEMWFPIDLSNDFYYQELPDTTPNGPTIGAPVLGSTFNDIQAIGSHLVVNNYDGSGTNNGLVELLDFNASFDAVFPPPPTPQSGFALAEWNMDTIVPGTSTTDQFGNVFTSDAVLDASMTPNPGLIGGDINDPLLLGDVTPGGSLGPVPASTKPTQTVGGMGFGGGEALQFDGVDDEALGITAWLADTSESLFIPGLDSVYVEVDFKEDANTGSGLQNIVASRTIWELRIDNDGNLEWVTWLEGGGSDTVEFALDEEGDWRNVQAFHNADGSKGLIVDGELVAQSFTGDSLRLDRRSILVGAEENGDRFFGGLIDNVFVGSGILDALLGDYNGNGVVDAADYTIWADTFNSTIDLAADGNGDGVVDAADYTIWADNFGNTAAVAVVIPEPHSLALLGLGGLAMLGRYRRSA